MLQSGYIYMPYVSHEKLIEEKKQEYYVALRKTQMTFKLEKADMLPWLTFFLNIILDQSKQAVELLSAENVENILSEKQLVVLKYLQEVKEAAPSEVAEKTGVLRPTVNKILEKLVSMKKVERMGQGRSTRYRIL